MMPDLIPVSLNTVLDLIQSHAEGLELYKYISVSSNGRSAIYDLRRDSITLNRKSRKKNSMRVSAGSSLLEKDFSTLVVAEGSDTELRLGFNNGDILTFHRKN